MHDGNAAAVRRATRRLQTEGRGARCWFAELERRRHAGHAETSLMMAVDPRRGGTCRLALAVGPDAPLGQLIGTLRVDGVAAVCRSGVLGDAGGAEAARGAALLDAAAAALAAFVQRWLGGGER